MSGSAGKFESTKKRGIMISISVYDPTSVLNVFATEEAFPLAKRFLSCPAAVKLVQSERIIKPLFIDIQKLSEAQTSIARYESGNPKEAWIVIPKDLQMTQGLHTLAFEIFHAQPSKSLFSRQLEKQELSEYSELIKQCENHWMKKPPGEALLEEYFNRHKGCANKQQGNDKLL